MDQFNPIAEEFFEAKPELLKEIKSFENRRNLDFLKKLMTDKDEINFFAWLSEIRFGLYFDNLCTDIKYDHKVDGKTPDWLVEMNEQILIAEVLRLNTPEDEHRKAIEQSRQMRRFQKENPGLPFYIRGPVKTMSLKFLSGCQSKLVKKEEKYRYIVQKRKVPFIICVAPAIDTFLFEQDFSDFFMGNRGFFKCDEYFKQNVTGVLLNTPFSKFFYYHNEDAEFQLTKKNLDVFKPLFYSMNF
jgi:hypothetical protein